MKQASRISHIEHKHSSHHTPLVLITRIFQAPVEWVWKAWSDPEIIKQWWGPTGHMSKYAYMEFREGGEYFLDLERPDGSVIWNKGTYEEIIPYKRIVCSDSFADKDGNLVLGNELGMLGNWPRKLYITIEFEEFGTYQTKMVVSHEGVPKLVHVKCIKNWNESLDKFMEVVERYGNEHLNMIQ